MAGRTAICGGCGSCARCKRAAAQRRWKAKLSPERAEALQAKRREYDRNRHERSQDKRRAKNRAYSQTEAGKQAMAVSYGRYKERHREKYLAHRRVEYALVSGTLERGPCERDGDDCWGRIHGHHDDYSRPLDVRWLCHGHHLEVHKELTSSATRT
jgi:hypothetical protein